MKQEQDEMRERDEDKPAGGGRSGDDIRDAGLMAAFVEGDATAMDRLATIYLPQVARYCYAIVRNEEAAADAAQETFLRVIQSAPRFNTSRPLKPWLFTLARRSCLDLQRQAARRAASLRAGAEMASGFQAGYASETGPDGAERSVVVAIDPTEDARELLNSKEEQRMALELLRDLDEDARDIIALRLFEDLAFNEIADIVGKPLSTVTTIYYRRLAKLRTLLERRVGSGVGSATGASAGGGSAAIRHVAREANR